MKQVFLLACVLSTVMSGPVEMELGDDWSDAAGYEECADWVDKSKPLPKSLDDICGADLECAPREEVANTDCGFGMRKVAAGKWVSTEILEEEGEEKYHNAFHRLYNYITGANSDGAEIPMTAPVISKTYMDADWKEIGATMHFYLPFAFQANPPSPTEDNVYMEDWDDALVYYRAIGESGEKISQDMWVSEFTNLYTALMKSGHGYYPYMSVVGGFTAPYDKVQRTEIMFVSN